MKTLAFIPLFFLILTQQCDAQSQWGNAVRFAGINGYIMVPDNPSQHVANTVTITAYVKRTRLGAIDFILEKGGDWYIGETNYGISLHGINSNMFYFIFDGGWRGTTGVQDTNWHHYAVVAVNGEPNPTFYIDGEVKAVQFSEGGAVINMNSSTNRSLNIGAQINVGATHYSANIIDELCVWNAALDSLQIRSMMIDTLGSAYYTTSDSGLVGYWRFDEFEDLGINGDGSDDVRDLSTSAAHGDATGQLSLVLSDITINFQLTVNVSNGWNMVSVPGVNPDGQGVNNWWINHIGNVYKFVPGSGYSPVSTTTPGEGYWMKNNGAQTYNTGDEWPAAGIQLVVHNPINAVPGWNLFGGYEDVVDPNALTTTPPGQIIYPVYKFVSGTGYQPATQLLPGYSYWVKVTSGCLINVPDVFR